MKQIARTLEDCRTLASRPLRCQKEVEYVLDVAPKHLGLIAPGCIDPELYVYAVRVSGGQAEFQPIPGFAAINRR